LKEAEKLESRELEDLIELPPNSFIESPILYGFSKGEQIAAALGSDYETEVVGIIMFGSSSSSNNILGCYNLLFLLRLGIGENSSTLSMSDRSLSKYAMFLLNVYSIKYFL
jgi:hypothetical protein